MTTTKAKYIGPSEIVKLRLIAEKNKASFSEDPVSNKVIELVTVVLLENVKKEAIPKEEVGEAELSLYYAIYDAIEGYRGNRPY